MSPEPTTGGREPHTLCYSHRKSHDILLSTGSAALLRSQVRSQRANIRAQAPRSVPTNGCCCPPCMTRPGRAPRDPPRQSTRLHEGVALDRPITVRFGHLRLRSGSGGEEGGSPVLAIPGTPRAEGRRMPFISAGLRMSWELSPRRQYVDSPTGMSLLGLVRRARCAHRPWWCGRMNGLTASGAHRMRL